MKNTFSFRLKNRFVTACLTGLCLLFTSLMLRAQTTDNFPVQTTVFFGGPSSQRLAEWFTSDKRLFIHLRLKDLTKPTLPVYLRWQLDGPGLRIATREGYVPPTFFSLTPGSLTRLNGTDLAAQYFSPSVLESEGLDPQQAYNASLPEGFYTFSVQAFEAATGQVVSNTAQTFLVLSSPQPPILNLPANGSSVPVTALQKVLFQWTPRHFATPSSQVVYRLKVCRVPDDEEPNEQTMLACTEPVLDQTVPATSLTGDQTQWIQPLQTGQRYAVQVQAIDLNNQLTNFAHQGYSAVQWFRYGRECLPPPSFSIKSVTSDRVRLNWETQAQALAYIVEYKAETAADWTAVKVYAPTHTVTGLQNKTTYLFRLRSDCGGLLPSAPSEERAWNISQEAPEAAPEWPKEMLQPELISVQTLDTVAVPVTTLQELYVNFPVPTANPAGDATPSGAKAASPADPAANVPVPITTKLKIPDCALRAGSFADCLPTHPVIPPPDADLKELTALSVGDVLGIYDFAVFVTKVNPESPLSGEGLVRLPFLGNALAPVEFKGVKAKKEEGDANGGCVYDVDPTGVFQLKNDVETKELAEQRQALVQALVQKSQPQAFVGTLQQALQRYDLTAKAISEAKQAGKPATPEQRQQLLQFTAAILQGSGAVKTQLDALGTENETVAALLKDLKALTDELEANRVTIEKGTDVPVIADLEAKYQALFERIKQLTATPVTSPTEPSTARITNVGIGNIDFQSAALTWTGGKAFAKYTVLYQADGEGELTQTVTSPQLALKSLKPGRNYTYKIVGYSETGEVLDTYGTGTFSTPANILPPPENLAYTVQTDGSVRINWNKNSLHQSFKLTYKTADGEERTLYPTTNSAVITGLAPDQMYLYDIVAYGTIANENLTSNVANSDFNTGANCELTVLMATAQTNPAIPRGTVYLAARGCAGGEISWTNGSAVQFIDRTTIRWADGESARLQDLNTLVVTPVTSKTYVARCQLPNGKMCTYPTDVRVAAAECPQGFTVSASKTVFDQGDDITLTATGCPGELRWSNGLGTAPTVRFIIQQEMTVSAQCFIGAAACPSNAIAFTLNPAQCLQAVFVSQQQWVKKGTKRLGICWGCSTEGEATLQATGCLNGTVTWAIGQGDASGRVNAYNDRVYSLTKMKGDVTVTASCTLPDGTVCPPLTQAVKMPEEHCNDRNLTLTYSPQDYPGKFLVKSTNGTPFLLKDAAGQAFNTTARSQVKVPFAPKDEIGYATFEPSDNQTACQAAIPLPAVVYRINWTNPTYYAGFKAGDDRFDASAITPQNGDFSLTMTAGATAQKGGNLIDDLGGCTGKLVWSNNRDNTLWETQALRLQNDYVIADSKTLIVRPLPRVTTTYYTTCYQNDRVFPVANPKTVVITSNDCMRLDPVPVSVTLGGSVSLTAVGCSGEVRWYSGATELGRGRTLVHTPLPATAPGQSSPVAYVYEAVCSDPGCRVKTSVSVKACRFLITAAKTLAKIAEPVRLNAEGCDGGQVEWNTGEAGATVTVKLLQNTVYSAKCVVNGQTLCTSNALTIDIDNQPPADIECPSFTLQTSLASVDKCAQQTVNIIPNCPAGAYIVWEDAVKRGVTEPYTVQLSDTKTITATCTTIYGLSVTKEITIAATAPQLTVSPTSAVVGYPVTLTAYGCYTPDCNQGAYSWKNLTTGITYSGQNITVKLAEDTRFEVRCNGSAPKVVDIAVVKQCENSPTVTVVNGKSKLKVSANPEYDITWYKVEPITRTTSKSTEIYKNVSSITVPQPACNSTTNFYPWYKAVYVNESGAVCTDVFNIDCNNGSSGTIITQEPTIPDPCNQWAFDEKIKVNPYESVYLYSSWCPGKVRWYSDEARTIQVGPELIGGAAYPLGKLSKTTTFYDCCTLSTGAVCEGSYTIKVSPKRVSTSEAIAATTASNCSPVSLQTALTAFSSHLICQSIELLKDENGSISTDKVEAFVTYLKSQFATDPVFNPTFTTAQLEEALKVGDICNSNSTAGRLLGASFSGTADYSTTILPNYGEIKNEVSELLSPSILTPLEPANFETEYEYIGETSLLTVGGLPSGNCVEYSATQDYAFCSNDKPVPSIAVQRGLLDEIGLSNINELSRYTEVAHWNAFKDPFELWNITEISNNFKTGANRILTLTKPIFTQNLAVSENLKTFEQSIIRTVWPKIQQNQIGLTTSGDLSTLSAPNLSERLWGLFPRSIYLAMGGTQRVDLKIQVYRQINLPVELRKDIKFYAFRVSHNIWDSFGMDWEDVNGWVMRDGRRIENNKGRSPLFEPLRHAFMLQHYHGYHPFFTNINYLHAFKLNKL